MAIQLTLYNDSTGGYGIFYLMGNSTCGSTPREVVAKASPEVCELIDDRNFHAMSFGLARFDFDDFDHYATADEVREFLESTNEDFYITLPDDLSFKDGVEIIDTIGYVLQDYAECLQYSSRHICCCDVESWMVDEFMTDLKNKGWDLPIERKVIRNGYAGGE